jgi:hypothetical protein
VNEVALLYDVVDRLDRIERRLIAREDATDLWIPKKRLAEQLGVSVRWIDYRLAEGLPHRQIAGRVVFRLPHVESWLRTRGLLKEAP